MNEIDNENGSMNSNRILTAVRVRPLSSSEANDGKKVILSLGNGEGDVNIVNPNFLNSNQSEKEKQLHERQFSYDYLFWSIPKIHSSRFSGQIEIYDKVGKPIIRNCLAGLNCSLFAYGKSLLLLLPLILCLCVCLRTNWFWKNLHHDGKPRW
jgi:hypothetical protein